MTPEQAWIFALFRPSSKAEVQTAAATLGPVPLLYGYSVRGFDGLMLPEFDDCSPQ